VARQRVVAPAETRTSNDGKIEVVVEGKAPPADTVVELNGVALVRETRNDDADRFWHVDAAVQPPVRRDRSRGITRPSGKAP